MKPGLAAALVAVVVAGCSGNDEAEALAADIRAATRPVVAEVDIDNGSWHEAWGVIVIMRQGTNLDLAHAVWCDVVLPAWNRRATIFDGAPADHIDIELDGAPIEESHIICS